MRTRLAVALAMVVGAFLTISGTALGSSTHSSKAQVTETQASTSTNATPKCFRYSANGFKMSNGYTVAGRNVRICRNKTSHTGWVKRGGYVAQAGNSTSVKTATVSTNTTAPATGQTATSFTSAQASKLSAEAEGVAGSPTGGNPPCTKQDCHWVPRPANKYTNDSSTSITVIKISSSTTKNIRTFEKSTGAVVGFNMMPGGLPKSQQHGCKWGDFAWSGWRTINGQIIFSKNAKHGRTHACWNGHDWIQIGGDKNQWNCGNVVYEFRPTHVRIVPRVIGFRSVSSFNSYFRKWVHKHNTSTHKVRYDCKGMGAGWKLAPNGTQCRKWVCDDIETPCPPNQFTTTGSTFVIAQRTVSAPCPGPGGVTKTGTSDVKRRDSPTFTGTGNTQAAADADLARQEADWRAANQSTVDSAAQAEAQARLDTALQTCSTTPPKSPPTISNLTQIQEMYVNEFRRNVCVDTYIPAGEGSGTVIFSVQAGTTGAGWFSDGTQQSVPNGNGHVCATFNAPTEPGTNRLVVTLYVSGQDPVSTSETVQILPSPPPRSSDE